MRAPKWRYCSLTPRIEDLDKVASRVRGFHSPLAIIGEAIEKDKQSQLSNSSSIDFTHHDVETAQDGGNIGDQAASA